jgi:hypothetical protein
MQSSHAQRKKAQAIQAGMTSPADLLIRFGRLLVLLCFGALLEQLLNVTVLASLRTRRIEHGVVLATTDVTQLLTPAQQQQRKQRKEEEGKQKTRRRKQKKYRQITARRTEKEDVRTPSSLESIPKSCACVLLFVVVVCVLFRRT